MVHSYLFKHWHSKNRGKTRCRLPAVFCRFLKFLYFHPEIWCNCIVAYFQGLNFAFFLFFLIFSVFLSEELN